MVCALTSNIKRANTPGNVLLETGEANLPRQSVVEVSKVSTVDKIQLGEYDLPPQPDPDGMLGLANKGGREMPRKRYSSDEIIHKLREAEVLLSQCRTVQEAVR